MMNEHSPTPFFVPGKQNVEGTATALVQDAGGFCVVECRSYWRADGYANAHFIVDACNAYDALREENEALILYTRALLALELCLDENIDDASVVDEASQRVKDAWHRLPPSVREKLEKETDDA